MSRYHQAVADLRFTIDRPQLRSLGFLTALLMAIVLVPGLMSSSTSHVSAGHISLARVILVGAGVLACLYPLTAYMLAFTECTPAGIRTRGLGGPRRCSWPEVADIGLRYAPRSVLISVTTVRGRRFWLGAPVHGFAAMGDEEFDDKLSQIQAYWQTITAGE